MILSFVRGEWDQGFKIYVVWNKHLDGDKRAHRVVGGEKNFIGPGGRGKNKYNFQKFLIEKKFQTRNALGNFPGGGAQVEPKTSLDAFLNTF